MHPTIDLVIIGLNGAPTLAACLASIQNLDYPRHLLHVYYVDGGSTDNSVECAQNGGATIVDYRAETPAPGGQRNAGWRQGTGAIVQFVDGDTQIDPQWLNRVVAALGPKIGAVAGNRREAFPDRSLFNWIGDQEWNGPAGDAETFGGDVAIVRTALEATDGYHPCLVGGEDPELSYRIRKAGFRIVQIDEPMTRHDLAMTTWRQYGRRAFRTGHAYAEVHAMHRDFWTKEVCRIGVRGGGFMISLVGIPLAFVTPWSLVLPLVGAGLLFLPLARGLRGRPGWTRAQSLVYGLHSSIVVIPQVLGVLRFHWGKWMRRPLTNRRLRLPS